MSTEIISEARQAAYFGEMAMNPGLAQFLQAFLTGQEVPNVSSSPVVMERYTRVAHSISRQSSTEQAAKLAIIEAFLPLDYSDEDYANANFVM